MVEHKDIYPNSPLVEVGFEMRFPGEPRVECNRDILYEKIRGDFQNVQSLQSKQEGFLPQNLIDSREKTRKQE